MSHQIDDSFRQKKKLAEAARAARLRRRIVLSAVGLLVLLASTGLYLTRDRWLADKGPSATLSAEAPAVPPPQPAFVNPIIDLAGDPLIIRFGGAADGSGKIRRLTLTPDLGQGGIPTEIAVLSDTMLSSSSRIMPLPSSPEDFALFQAQSGRGRPPPAAEPAAAAPSAAPAPDASADDDGDVLVPVDSQNDPSAEPVAAAPESEPSDGLIGPSAAGAVAATDAAAAAAFKPTAIENTTTVHPAKPEAERFATIEDFTVTVKGERPLAGIATEYRFSAEEGAALAEAAKRIIGTDMLGDGYVVGLRGARQEGGTAPFRLVQVSVNAPGKYLGTIALSDAGTFVAGADPWIDDDLDTLAQDAGNDAPATASRLLDAIYNTATRNQVPSGVTGEAIMLLSRSFDLQATATSDQRLVIIYADGPRDSARNLGRVLYAAIRGGSQDLECFVYQAAPGGDFSCMTDKDVSRTVSVTNGMVTPVNGVLTARFGMRMHPILHIQRMHKGVDWAAPLGSPVMAAFDGTIESTGSGGDYGNVVRITHSGGRETAYGHLLRFQDGIRAGVAVRAGDIIGYIGTSGLSTGPHLHFELYANGVPTDPLATVVAEQSDDSAVDRLVDRIIHVESGGSARAKNPLSSATGLGQFISSTWMRMIKTYHPEMIGSMSSEAILALRFDPVISTEMVGRLARENEATLRGFGHAITAGRLYLAHFLGPQGAHIVLAAPTDASLEEILGASVIRANPFLTGKDAAFVIAWAEKKMNGKAPAQAAVADASSTITKGSPEFDRYREAMKKVVQLASAAF